MCEHEFVFGRINATHCKRCNDTEQEIILREQLAAANARVAELETKRETRPVLYWRNKAEAAEAQCAVMRTAINRYVLGNIELLDALKAALEDKP